MEYTVIATFTVRIGTGHSLRVQDFCHPSCWHHFEQIQDSKNQIDLGFRARQPNNMMALAFHVLAVFELPHLATIIADQPTAEPERCATAGRESSLCKADLRINHLLSQRPA